MKTMAERKDVPGLNGASKFNTDCFPYIFTIEELAVLEKRGYKMKALFEGKAKPVTEAEKSFIKVCKGQATADSVMETAWLKYLNRRHNEAVLMQTAELYKEYRNGRNKRIS